MSGASKRRMNVTPLRRSRRNAGFTLIEIMVVIVILGLVATLVANNVWANSQRAREEKARFDARQIANAVRMFQVDHGRLPQLEELIAPDAKGRSYLIELPDDPWQTTYLLREAEPPQGFEVRSCGPNKLEGDADDISSRQ